MNHYGGKEMAASFRTVRKNTIQIATDIPEGKVRISRPRPIREPSRKRWCTLPYGSDFAPSFTATRFPICRRSISRSCFRKWRRGIQAPDESRTDRAPGIEGRHSSPSYLEGLPDSFMAETIAMPPGGTPASRTRFDMLLSAKEHEMHHRGQLMVLERMVGVVPHLTRQREAQQAARAAGSAGAKDVSHPARLEFVNLHCPRGSFRHYGVRGEPWSLRSCT